MKAIEFIHELTWDDLPVAAQQYARRCLLDTLGTAIGGRGTEMSRIVHDFAAANLPGPDRLWMDGRPVSALGAVLAHGMTIDSLDIHDGHSLTKGHSGVAVVPAALATRLLAPRGRLAGRELLATLIVGYEIAIRAGIALHATSCDFHTSGAWNALGAAAVAARRAGLSAEQTRHALGIAEYYGPRSQMMRVIDHPTMVKDGAGWGAMAGVSAALLAREGFTGAPGVTVEAPELRETWADVGERWLITEQYFKPHAICRWAQPAVEGVLALKRAHHLAPEQVRRVHVVTFHTACRLQVRRPSSTEEAQYSLPFPVAAALVYGQLGPEALTGAALHDAAVLDLAERVDVVEDPGLTARFPAERRARVRIETTDGRLLESGEVGPRWDAGAPPTDADFLGKFRWLAGSMLPQARAAALEDSIWNCAELEDVEGLVSLMTEPVKL